MVKSTRGHSYQWVDSHRKQRLLHLVASGMQIVQAARVTCINYGNAKWMVRMNRKRGLKPVIEVRRPRLRRIFKIVRPTKSKFS